MATGMADMLDKLLAQGAAVRKGASSSTSTTVGRSARAAADQQLA
jgi:hypothetical protein